MSKESGSAKGVREAMDQIRESMSNPLMLTSWIFTHAAWAAVLDVQSRAEAEKLADRAAGRSFPMPPSRVWSEGCALSISGNPGMTVSAILARLESTEDPLVDLQFERPSLDERFLSHGIRPGDLLLCESPGMH